METPGSLFKRKINFKHLTNLVRFESAIVAFIVSKNEINIGDQRLLEYKCIELESSIKINRYTLHEVYLKGRLDEHKKLIMLVMILRKYCFDH